MQENKIKDLIPRLEQAYIETVDLFTI